MWHTFSSNFNAEHYEYWEWPKLTHKKFKLPNSKRLILMAQIGTENILVPWLLDRVRFQKYSSSSGAEYIRNQLKKSILRKSLHQNKHWHFFRARFTWYKLRSFFAIKTAYSSLTSGLWNLCYIHHVSYVTFWQENTYADAWTLTLYSSEEAP